MNFDDWLITIPEEDLDKIALPDVWNAAIDATINALVDAGNLSEHYLPEWTETVEKIKDK